MDLIGRDAELARLRELVERGAGALVIDGVPGVGKSALLAAVRPTEGRTLMVTGVQSEIELPFSALSELLAPVVDGIDAIPAVQRRALRAALSLDAPAGLDRGTVLHACTALLGRLAAGGPLLVCVDDVQWLDESSREAIGFVARRAERLGVVVLVVRSRRGEPLDGWPTLPTLSVGELGRADALALAGWAGVTAAVAEALVDALGGNPLALLQGPAELTAAQRAGQDALPEQMPAGERLNDAYAARLARLPPRTRAALVLAAASSDGATVPLAAALAPDGMAAFAPAEDDGLVRLDERRVRFAHPVVRTAVYHAAAPTERRAAHRALAEVLPEPERARQLAVAADRPDEALAAALERSALDAAARGAPGTALHVFERAAALTPDPVRARGRTLAAGHLALVAGRPQAALALASGLPPAVDPRERADTQLVVGIAAGQTGRPSEAYTLLAGEADRIADLDPGRAAGLLTQAAIALIAPGPMDRLLAVADRARALSPPGAELVPEVLQACAHVTLGEHARGRQVLRAQVDALRGLDPTGPGHEIIAVAALCLFWLEELDEAERLLVNAVRTVRERGGVTPLAFPLTVLASVRVRRGDFRAAWRIAEEAAGLGEDAIGSVLHALTLNSVAFTAGYLGRREDCVENAQAARALGERLELTTMRALAEQAMGCLALSSGETAAAIVHLERSRALAIRFGSRDPSYLYTEADLAEAYVRAGRVNDARRVVDGLTDGATRTGGSWARAAAARCAALVDDDAAIDDHLAVALDAHARVSLPFELARTQLCVGERLRRARRRSDARPLLADAEATFRAQGARLWAARAAAELAATGPAARPKAATPAAGADVLTPREGEVCALVAAGATNAEVAAALFVFPRTVEHHLRQAYRKLGLRSRAELARRFSAG